MQRPLLLLLFCLVCLAAGDARAQPSRALPSGFVYLSELAPAIEQDLRYATRTNFTGAPVDGYEAGVCILTRATAEALARVQRELERIDPELTLKVYDCYRPVRAVRRFRAWVETSGRGEARGYHYPNAARQDLISLGYISRQSDHSRGNAVDITIANRGAVEGDAPLTRSTSSCTDPGPRRDADTSLEMGTDFDCFDRRSHTRAPGLSAEATRGRQLLLTVMARQGFRNYWREWWHFTYPAGGSGRAYDFVIRAPAAVGR